MLLVFSVQCCRFSYLFLQVAVPSDYGSSGLSEISDIEGVDRFIADFGVDLAVGDKVVLEYSVFGRKCYIALLSSVSSVHFRVYSIPVFIPSLLNK